ncbi:hypothetical protein [Candidatus Puniceispirillum sp.]|uniref:hypothetical protein n=1 Tax=Candidatus Puniceispirillum sp. TaxID=2026719 RepID=UPI003F69783F
MRSEILINKKGIVQSSESDATPEGGVCVTRTNQEFSIFFDDKPEVPALMSLIRTLRSASGLMNLSGANVNKSNQTPQDVFITIAQMAIKALEAEPDINFKSHLELFSYANLDKYDLPEALMPLARLNLLGKDVPSALMQVVNANIENLVSVGQTMSMRLCFLSTPPQFSWPDATIEKGDALDECLPKDSEYWLSILYETAFALKLPLYHHGHITMPDTQTGTTPGNTQYPFHRLIYPLAPASDRPHNYRVLSVACITDPEHQPII